MSNHELILQINGKSHTFNVPPTKILLDLLQDDLGLFGTRQGCGIGYCGACTVLVEGRALCSCLLLVGQLEGNEITTIEGLADGEKLHPVQQAFIDQTAFQCAYCTPGFILSTVALLAENPNPDETAIRTYLAGNLCRCGSYLNILEAVKQCLEHQLEKSSK